MESIQQSTVISTRAAGPEIAIGLTVLDAISAEKA